VRTRQQPVTAGGQDTTATPHFGPAGWRSTTPCHRRKQLGRIRDHSNGCDHSSQSVIDGRWS
jgi:hypothetical protein